MELKYFNGPGLPGINCRELFASSTFDVPAVSRGKTLKVALKKVGKRAAAMIEQR
jgi:hypothetical protein